MFSYHDCQYFLHGPTWRDRQFDGLVCFCPTAALPLQASLSLVCHCLVRESVPGSHDN